MFNVICIKEARFNISPYPSKIKVGEEYHVTEVFTDETFGAYYFLAEDLPTQAYSAELFAVCDGPDEVALLEERIDMECEKVLGQKYAELGDDAQARICERIQNHLDQNPGA